MDPLRILDQFRENSNSKNPGGGGYPITRLWNETFKGATEAFGSLYLLAGRRGLRGLPSWRGMSSAAEHHGHAGRRSSMVGAE